MSKPKVFILDPYYPAAIDLLQSSTSVEAVLRDDPRSPQWREEAAGIMIRSETRVTAADLEQAKKLKVVVKQGVGVDNIDLDAAKQYGIAVCNTPAMNSEGVAELTIALALCISRRVVELDRRVRSGEAVIRSDALGMSLFTKTIGIVGMGNIGTVLAKKWIGAMEGDVIAYDPYAPEIAWPGTPHRRVKDLNELLRDADVVSLHVPLTKSTRNMIGKREFQLMKKNTIFLNCARGGVVDESALLAALSEGKFYGVGLDAMLVEPPTMEAYSELLKHDNVVMVPHVGGNTEENQIISGRKVVETVLAVLNGEEVPNRLV
jgi:D-3-phosphoglycerate dehydrogenase / 2-oxoglutarate reductase